MRVLVSFYSISFEHEAKTGEMDLNPTASSTDPPELPLLPSMGCGP